MTNQSLRERFNLSETKADAASRIISDAVAAEVIKADDPESRSKRYAKYIPLLGLISYLFANPFFVPFLKISKQIQHIPICLQTDLVSFRIISASRAGFT
ncbi:hypothetical protein [Mailhella sp.]|uniref:hypothetical protein n=1 Tax=Mailhella sp. TaxID=1981029 RepID=UPI0040646224